MNKKITFLIDHKTLNFNKKNKFQPNIVKVKKSKVKHLEAFLIKNLN